MDEDRLHDGEESLLLATTTTTTTTTTNNHYQQLLTHQQPHNNYYYQPLLPPTHHQLPPTTHHQQPHNIQTTTTHQPTTNYCQQLLLPPTTHYQQPHNIHTTTTHQPLELLLLIAAYLRGRAHTHASAAVAALGRAPRCDWAGRRLPRPLVPAAPPAQPAQPDQLMTLVSLGLAHIQASLGPPSLVVSALGAPSLCLPPPAAARPALPLSLAQRESSLCRPPCLPSSLPPASFAALLVSLRGHLAPVYSAIFDRTATRIFSAADDALVKAWHPRNGFLVDTIRAHQSFLSSAERVVVIDIDIDHANNVLASAASDLYVRLWDARSFAPIQAILVGKEITTISFSPSPDPDNMGLLVTCADSKSRLYPWNPPLRRLDPVPFVLDCGTLARDQVRCAAFNPTGTRFAAGGSDGIIYLFSFLSRSLVIAGSSPNDILAAASHPTLIRQFDCHNARLTDLCFSARGDRILSGSKDGSLVINHFSQASASWKRITIPPPSPSTSTTPSSSSSNPPSTLNPADPLSINARAATATAATAGANGIPLAATAGTNGTPLAGSNETHLAGTNGIPPPNPSTQDHLVVPLEIHALCWSADDARVVASYADFGIRVYDSFSGDCLSVLSKHTKAAVALEPHPFDERLVVSTGIDGRAVFWDICRGVIIHTAEFPDALLAASFSVTGHRLVITDNAGGIHIFGSAADAHNYAHTPEFQFFGKDTKIVRVADHLGGLVDDETQVPAHVVPQGLLMDQSGTPYPDPTLTRRKTHLDWLNTIETEPSRKRLADNLAARQSLLEEERQRIAYEQRYMQSAQVIDKKLLKKRREHIVESDNEVDVQDVMLMDVPIVPLPDSSGDNYSGNDDDEDDDDLDDFDDRGIVEDDDEDDGEGVDHGDDDDDGTLRRLRQRARHQRHSRHRRRRDATASRSVLSPNGGRSTSHRQQRHGASTDASLHLSSGVGSGVVDSDGTSRRGRSGMAATASAATSMSTPRENRQRYPTRSTSMPRSSQRQQRTTTTTASSSSSSSSSGLASVGTVTGTVTGSSMGEHLHRLAHQHPASSPLPSRRQDHTMTPMRYTPQRRRQQQRVQKQRKPKRQQRTPKKHRRDGYAEESGTSESSMNDDRDTTEDEMSVGDDNDDDEDVDDDDDIDVDGSDVTDSDVNRVQRGRFNRHRSRRVVVNDDDDDNGAGSSRNVYNDEKSHVGIDDDDDDAYDGGGGGSRYTKPKGKGKAKVDTPIKQREAAGKSRSTGHHPHRNKTRQRVTNTDDTTDTDDMKASWVGATKQAWSPYLPQLGDTIVYIKTGHKTFTETVIKTHQHDTGIFTHPDMMKMVTVDDGFGDVVCGRVCRLRFVPGVRYGLRGVSVVCRMTVHVMCFDSGSGVFCDKASLVPVMERRGGDSAGTTVDVDGVDAAAMVLASISSTSTLTNVSSVSHGGNVNGGVTTTTTTATDNAMQRGDLVPKMMEIAFWDMDGMPDFVILYDDFVSGVKKCQPMTRDATRDTDDWKVGDVAILRNGSDEYEGKVVDIQPRGDYWCMYAVEFDQTDSTDTDTTKVVDMFSPWEIRRPCTPKPFTETLPERDTCRLISLMNSVMKMDDLGVFVDAVPVTQFPSYPTVIGYPVHLSLIRDRLMCGYYRRIASLQWDIDTMMGNVLLFNRPSSGICYVAVAVFRRLREVVVDTGCEFVEWDVGVMVEEERRRVGHAGSLSTNVVAKASSSSSLLSDDDGEMGLGLGSPMQTMKRRRLQQHSVSHHEQGDTDGGDGGDGDYVGDRGVDSQRLRHGRRRRQTTSLNQHDGVDGNGGGDSGEGLSRPKRRLTKRTRE